MNRQEPGLEALVPSGSLASRVEALGYWLNYVNERLCALLVAATVAVVWFGIVERYVLAMGATWTEELARYLMIWAALMAVPCCTYRREHIGLDLVFSRLPPAAQRPARIALDALGLAFFAFLSFYSFPMVRQGGSQYASIFGMTMTVPFLSVTVSCLLTVVQILVCMMREYGRTVPLFVTREGA
ncbi:MAG: TRAP transporter small permease [Desulfovibrionaceae bacterium]|jgi:TRAP-type C4-dicarboxylate transport system permease small subunit|nr:TRAP transporter small permease [Desulfovibrionaceae bacterium]